MIHGTLLLVATGLCWVLIAVVISTAARRRLDLDFIQAGAALLTAAAGEARSCSREAPRSPFRSSWPYSAPESAII